MRLLDHRRVGLEAYHLWRNLFGQAERLRLDARVASIAFPIDTAQFDYFFGGTFTKPGILTPDTDLIAAISAERTSTRPSPKRRRKERWG